MVISGFVIETHFHPQKTSDLSMRWTLPTRPLAKGWNGGAGGAEVVPAEAGEDQATQPRVQSVLGPLRLGEPQPRPGTAFHGGWVCASGFAEYLLCALGIQASILHTRNSGSQRQSNLPEVSQAGREPR